MAKKPSRYVDPQAPLDNNNLPITSYGSVDSSIPNFSKTYTETPHIADTGTATYVGDQYEHNSLDDQNVYQEDLPNIEDERASNQSTLGALGDATAKFLGKTIMSTVGNLAGTIYGVGAAVGEGKISDIWDNSFMNAVDTADKGLDNFFKVYKNADYQDQNILQKLFLHPTQFTDEATDTASFMAGAILSEIATSGLGSETIVPKALKYMKFLSEGAEASEATKALTSLTTKGITLAGDLGTSIKHLAMGASYEGIVEARQATMELRDKMYSDYQKDHPNEDVPQSVKDDIDDRLSKAGVFTYLSNLALVGSTNLLLFPKLFGLGHETSKIAADAIERDATTGLFKAANEEKHSLLDNITTGLTKPFEESTKFGIQGTVSKTAKEFWDRKNDPEAKKNVNDLLETFATQLADTYTSKEGWNNIGMGMIIGALGAPGRGILAPLGESHPLGKYGYSDITDANGNTIGKQKLPSWTGGIAGSFQERAQEEAKVGKVVADLNEHTNFFKAAKANYDTLVENNSLQKDQDKAVADGDIFDFQNAKDDQIHSYVSSRIKNNLYDDLLDEVSKIKKLSPDEFYTNFKGEEAANNANNFEKIKFQQETVKNFLERAKNTRDAIKIADDVYKGDNEDLRDHLTHSIAASKNLDLRERLINQSLADLSNGAISNLNTLGTTSIKDELNYLSQDKELNKDRIEELNKASNKNITVEEHNMMNRFAQTDPTSYTLNRDKIQDLLADSRKLRAKRQDYLDVYNHLYTQEGQKQFEDHQEKQAEEIQKQQDLELQKKEDKQKEDIKKQNIKETVDKAKDVTKPKPTSRQEVEGGGLSINFEDELDNNYDEAVESNKGTKEASGEEISTKTTPNTTEVTESPVEANNSPVEEESNLTPEETAVVRIEDNKEVKANRELITTSNNSLIRNTSIEHYNQLGEGPRLVNTDTLRQLGNTIIYLGIDKITLGKLGKNRDVITHTFDIFDEDGNIQVNKFVDPRLFSQNHYKVNSAIELFVPTIEEMEERGLQDYSHLDYSNSIDNPEEFPIAMRGEDGKIIGYLPTRTNIIQRVQEEFREQALEDNRNLREYIFDNKEQTFKSKITSKSPGWVIADKLERQKSLFEALGDKNKLADKVKLAIVKPVNRDIEPTQNDIYTDNSGNPFVDGEIINANSLQAGLVYSILPTSQESKYVIYPTKINSIGLNNARIIVEALKLFANRDNLSTKEKESINNIKEFEFKNFKDVSDFVNRIIYGSSKVDAPDNNVFKLYKNRLYLSGFDENKKFALADIASNKTVQEEVANILSERYFSVGLKDLNSKEPYISYHLNDNGVVEEKENQSYQHYLNDQGALTSNVRGVHISGNEYAFTAQSVLGISNEVDKITKEIAASKDQDIEEATIIPDSYDEVEESKSKEEEAPKKKFTTKKLNIDPDKLRGKSLEDINPIVDKFRNENEILAAPKILKTLALPKIEALFNNQFLKGNREKFYQEVTSLGAGKEQTQILKNWIEENNPKTIEDLKIGIAAELSYTTEINITHDYVDSAEADRLDRWYDNRMQSLANRQEFSPEPLSDEEYNNAIDSLNSNYSDYLTRVKEQPRYIPTSFYSNLTAPGGTNYKENEISTPQIEPSIKGHAQFSTKNGIGWFRSDEKNTSITSLEDRTQQEWEDISNATGFSIKELRKQNTIQGSINNKIRRVLEVQSDLFQKSRHLVEQGRPLINYKANPKLYDKGKDQFLNLLAKDNNWVNFFIKSIIQDSARKGYEEVHFPTGNTASKIEGHTTLEEHKANIQSGLHSANQELDRLIRTRDSLINGTNEDYQKFRSSYQNEGDLEISSDKDRGIESFDQMIESQTSKVEDWQRQLNEIETEGFAKLKPIYNFYENQVQNILKKNYTVERVKDKHGNEWNKINLEEAHKGQIYYDITPQQNFSVMSKLFVDLDKFTDNQQREVIDSIIYTIEEGKAEGYSTVEDLFDYAREVFNNTKEYFADLNEDQSLTPTINKFQDIDDDWDKFREKVLDRLKGIGIKVAKTFETNITTEPKEEQDTPDLIEEDGDSPKEDFVATESTYVRSNYADNFAQSISSKDTASAHLKLKLSLIPEVELVNGKIEPTTNFLGMSKMMDLNKVWTALQGVLTGIKEDQIYPTISELAKNNPMYSTILSNIQGDPNTNIQNEFVVAFSKRQAKPVTVKIGYADKASNRTINVFGTNRQGANNILMDSWYDKFKNSPYVKDDGLGNLVVYTDGGKAAYDAFTRFMESYNIKDLNLAANLQKGLSSIGIELSLPTIDNLIKNGTRIGRAKLTGKEFLNRFVSPIFKRLASGYTDKETIQLGESDEEQDSKLALNNPFISETTGILALAKLENITNPFLFESSYVGGDGKPRYSISNNTYLSKFFNRLDSGDFENFIKEKLTTTYAANSIWGNKLVNDPTFRNNFSYHDLDSLGNYETKSPNKVFSRMNTKEKEFTRIALFQNKGRESSIFLAPIPSDKTTIPAVEVPRVKVLIDANTYEVRNREAISALYTPFISEYNRIREVQEQQSDPKLADKLIAGYHNGMGEKFLVYDFLNKNSELFDENGKLKIVDSQTLKKIVTPEIEKFTTELIKNQLKYWNKLGLYEKDSPFFDKTYQRKAGDFEDIKHLNRQFAADYAINQFLAHFNYTQLISGDPALHGKKNIDATWINYNKRLAKDIAPGLDGNFKTPNFNTVFLKDLSYKSKHLDEYREVLGEKSEAYRKINPADAQEYTTLKEHLAVMEAYGKLTPLLKAAGERLQNGGEDPFDVDLILQPTKPVYVGTKVDNTMGIDRMYYIKTSSFPLIPAITKGLEIDKLRIAMENGNIDRAVYESGTKVGLPINNVVSIESSQGKFRDDLNIKDNAISLSRDGFRIQQEIPYHSPSDHPSVNEGTQGRKLILADVEDTDKLNLFGKEFTGKEAKDFYEGLHVEKMNRAYSKLLDDIGVSKDYQIKDLSKLQKILLEEATSRNYNINDVYGLQIEKVDGKQRFKIPLGFNNSSNRLESILNSLFTNRVIKSELPGFSKIQGSSVGFSKIKSIDQINSQIKDSIIWVNPSGTELNYIRKNEDGKTLLQSDILLPSWFIDKDGKDIDVSKFVKEDGTLDTDKLPEDLLTTIGIRIPTQGYNSMMSFKVKGFLPKYVGDLAIVPAEITAQMGSDFDVDKLFIYRYHYNYDGDKLTKVNPDVNKDFSQFSNEEIDNSIVQYYEDRYKDVSLLPKILEPNGYGNLPDLAKEIGSIQKLDSDNHFFTTIKQNEFHKNNNDGIAGRGIFSLFSTFVRAAQDAKLELKEGEYVSFKIGDKILRANKLYTQGYIEGRNPLTVIQYFQSASVDNAKEQLLGTLNVNPLTMDVAGTIALAGFNENMIGYFLSQPVIREYVDKLSNSNDITNPVFESNTSREDKVVSDLYSKYVANEAELEEEKIFSEEDLRDQLKEPNNTDQNRILTQFLDIKNLAKDIRQLQSAITTDTNGLGIRYVDLQVKENNINIARYGSKLVNAERLFNDSTIGRASDIVSDALRIYSNILPYNTPSYKTILNETLVSMGKGDRADLNSKDLKSIYDNIKSFIYSKRDLLGIEDPNSERFKLLYGSNSLGNRWEAYTKTPAGKKNLLSERILVRRGDTTGTPIRLEALNTPAANSSDNSEAMASYYRMYYKGTEEEKSLAKDIVNYFILTGAQQGANSIARYIPYDILEEHDFSNKLHGIDNNLRDPQDDILEGSIEQFFQHNPNKAIAFDVKDKDIHDYKLDGFIMLPDSKYLVADGEGHLTYPTYMSVYSKALKDFALYKIKESSDKGTTYSRIDLLGDRGISEYNAQAKEGQYSIIKNNQAGLPIPSNVNARVEDKDDSLLIKDNSRSTEVLDKDYLTKQYDLDNSNPETTLNKIIESNNKEFSNIASDLKRVVANYPNLKIDLNEDREGVSGKYSSDTAIISINLDNILSRTSDPIESTERTILHEFLHAVTSKKIDNYSNLSEEDQKSVDKIKILLNQYKRSVDQNELFRFNDLTRELKEGKPISQEDADWYRDNKGKYYPLTNIHEFVAAGLTEPNFTQQLKDNNFWTKLWDTISKLLGLNRGYKSDYDALYDTSINLGGKESQNGSNSSLEDLNPKDAKQEFLSKYHLYDGKPMTTQNFDRINSSVRKNDKYSNIKLDLAWENGQRVLRVFTKGGTPLYDINPKAPKSKEELIIEKSLKRLYDYKNRLESNPSFSKNIALQAKVEDLKDQIKDIKENNVVHLITAMAKDKIVALDSVMDRDGIMSQYDIEEAQTYISWYKNIRDYINYNEAFEEENKDLDEIVRKASDLEKRLYPKMAEALAYYGDKELNTSIDIAREFTSPQKDVGNMESTWISGAFSTSHPMQFIQTLIRKNEQKTLEDFNNYKEDVVPVFKEFQKKYKNYDLVKQFDKEGNWTGRLLNKYSQDYYDKLIEMKGKSKDFAKFYRENTKLEISEKDQERFDRDLEELKQRLPEWDKEGSYDSAVYNRWYSSHNPNEYIAKVKKGMRISSEERARYKNYVTVTPSDKWLDPRYRTLKAFGEDSVEMKVYNELDKQFRSLARHYDNEANYIPEVSKDFSEKIFQGEYKGAFKLLKESMQDAISTKLESQVNSNARDINGVPIKAVPVYMMSNMLNPENKSDDLGRVLLMAKLQEYMLNHKTEVEPYLLMAKSLLQGVPQLRTNSSGDAEVDQYGDPILDHSPGRLANTKAQSDFIVNKYLYDQEKEQVGTSKTPTFTKEEVNNKGEVNTKQKALSTSKIVDSISNYTRAKALGINPVSAVGRIMWGVLSNTIYAGDRKAYGEREATKSLGYMVMASIPGTSQNRKVKALAELFNMRQQLGEIKFGKLGLPSINNPLTEKSIYFLVDKGEDFIQHQTGISVLMKQKVKDLQGNESDLFDAFDNDGKWIESKFGPNPYSDEKTKLDLAMFIQSTVTAVHGDYGDATQASDKFILRNLMTMRKWLPRSMDIRFGKEYTDLQGNVQKGRYRSYEVSHLNPLNLIRDFYKAFTIDPNADNIDYRNLRMNAYELAFIPVLWGAALALKGLVHGIYHNDDEEKAALTFLLNSTTRVSGDLTFFFNPYSFQSTLREPIPAFKTIMDFYDLGPAVLQTLEGKGTYKTGIHRGSSKLGVRLAKAIPVINQPEKAYGAIKQELEK